MRSTALAHISVGVVVDRRKAKSMWVDDLISRTRMDKIIAELTGKPPMTVQDFVASHREAFTTVSAEG